LKHPDCVSPLLFIKAIYNLGPRQIDAGLPAISDAIPCLLMNPCLGELRALSYLLLLPCILEPAQSPSLLRWPHQDVHETWTQSELQLNDQTMHAMQRNLPQSDNCAILQRAYRQSLTGIAWIHECSAPYIPPDTLSSMVWRSVSPIISVTYIYSGFSSTLMAVTESSCSFRIMGTISLHDAIKMATYFNQCLWKCVVEVSS